MQTTMRTIQLFVVMVVCAVVLRAQPVEVVGGVITSGYTPTLGGSTSVRGMVGQPIVDLDTIVREVTAGYAHTIDAYTQRGEGTDLRLPQMIQAVGDTFSFTINAAVSCLLFHGNPSRAWEAKISFNGTMLEPLGVNASAVEDVDGRYTLTLTGTTSSALTSLVTQKFLARLGNDSVTDVTVSSFRWLDVPRQVTTHTPGEVRLRGICSTYGNARLLTQTPVMVQATPNPVYGSVVALRLYAQRATTGTLIVTDLQGTVITTREGVALDETWARAVIDLGLVSAGSYTVTVVTPEHVGRTTIVKMP
jgi:hypothetical protein